jgi:hypothetical protein
MGDDRDLAVVEVRLDEAALALLQAPQSLAEGLPAVRDLGVTPLPGVPEGLRVQGHDLRSDTETLKPRGRRPSRTLAGR